MGVMPGEAHLAVALPEGAELEDALALHAAAGALAEEAGAVLVGGDITRGPALTIAAFVIGWAANEAERDRARRGTTGRPARRARARSAGRGRAWRSSSAAPTGRPRWSTATAVPSHAWPRAGRSRPPAHGR